MPEFAYEALTAAGSVTRGAMKAATESELEERLRAEGQYLIRATPVAVQKAAALAAIETRRTDATLSRVDLLAFTEYLAGGTTAGLPLLSILDDVVEHLQSTRLKQVVREMREAVAERGMTLSEAMAEHPRAFSQLFVGAVQAGEATGQLDYVLTQLVEYLDWQENIVTQVRQATLYPAIVLGVVLLLVLALLVFVYPRLLPLLQSFNVPLPLPTRVLMGVSSFMRDHWRPLLAGSAAVALAAWAYLRTESGRWAQARLVLRLPVVGRFILEVNMARFVTYLGLFYRAGVELIHGLTIIEEMLPNRVLARGVHHARVEIAGGSSIATAFSRTGNFPSLVLRAIALGESTGSLDDALQRAKAYYDRELPAAVRRLLTGLQPLLIILLGGIVATVALSIFLPILAIYRSVGR